MRDSAGAFSEKALSGISGCCISVSTRLAPLSHPDFVEPGHQPALSVPRIPEINIVVKMPSSALGSHSDPLLAEAKTVAEQARSAAFVSEASTQICIHRRMPVRRRMISARIVRLSLCFLAPHPNPAQIPRSRRSRSGLQAPRGCVSARFIDPPPTPLLLCITAPHRVLFVISFSFIFAETAFKQQRLSASFVVFTPKWMISLFLFLGVAFIVIGGVHISTSNKVCILDVKLALSTVSAFSLTPDFFFRIPPHHFCCRSSRSQCRTPPRIARSAPRA